MERSSRKLSVIIYTRNSKGFSPVTVVFTPLRVIVLWSTHLPAVYRADMTNCSFSRTLMIGVKRVEGGSRNAPYLLDEGEEVKA